MHDVFGLSPKALFIDGQWVAPGGGAMEDVIDPATEEVLGQAPVGNVNDAQSAIAAARTAFDAGPWRKLQAVERQVHLQAWYDALSRRETRIRTILAREVGSVVAMTNGLNFGTPMAYARFVIEQTTRSSITNLPVETIPASDGTTALCVSMTVREPIGVCAAITAFNAPFMFNVIKSFPALAAGNTVVLKPSPYTPFSALILAEAAVEAGLPAGVFNIVTGESDVGRALSADPRVDLISFTGSDSVGASIQAQAAPTLKRLVLELGGKSALIVCADADLQQAAAFITGQLTVNSGQGCGIPSRVLVHNTVRAEFVRLTKAMMRAVTMGDPADPRVTMGPLIREAQRTRTEYYVQLALKEGATLVTGGRRPSDHHRGFWYEPTLFDDVSNKWRIAREEVFGPVGVVIGFDSDDEAIAIANDSEFGLAGGVFSKNVGRAYNIALQVRTGRFWINGGGRTVFAAHGGIRRSGYGREFGLEGMDEYSYSKSITFRGA